VGEVALGVPVVGRAGSGEALGSGVCGGFVVAGQHRYPDEIGAQLCIRQRGQEIGSRTGSAFEAHLSGGRGQQQDANAVRVRGEVIDEGFEVVI